MLFGPDITENFCAVNGVSLVIRSHECMQEGFAVRVLHRGWAQHASVCACRLMTAAHLPLRFWLRVYGDSFTTTTGV